MQEQKKVHIIGFKAMNHRVIKAVELTPDITSKKLIQITGESGNGKSTVINMLKTALNGKNAIDKKDTLEKGYLSEVLLKDGETKIYLGAKVVEYQRGEKEGEPKFDFFLYSKDVNGKAYTPILDGATATAAEYQKELTTPLTFSMNEFFSENQTTHRKLIEKLFKPELEKMKVDEVVDRIQKAKIARDVARQLTQANGAYMEQFKNDGLTEDMLKMISKIDMSALEKEKQKLLSEKAVAEANPESEWKLKCAEIDAKRTADLQAIKDAGTAAREAKDADERKKKEEFENAKAAHDTYVDSLNDKIKVADNLKQEVELFFKQNQDSVSIVIAEIEKERESAVTGLAKPTPTLKPADPALVDKYNSEIKRYQELGSAPVAYPEKGAVDTTEIDKKLSALDVKIENARANNKLYDRFSLWEDWTAKKATYEQEIDTLRKMYASIETGVDGLSIVPFTTDSGRVEVWMQYDGSYDEEFFHNFDKELRHVFAYSSFQRSAIGVMLQAARLNLKPKALRLATIDDVAFTTKGLSVLSRLCEDLDVQLITAKTADPKIEELQDGEVLVQNGELFYNK